MAPLQLHRQTPYFPYSLLFVASSYFKSPKFIRFYFLSPSKLTTSFFVRSLSTYNHQNQDSDSNSEEPKISKKLSKESSWEAKDSKGKDYLYRLGKESYNMNIAVGARAGIIDDLFSGKFLGRDCKDLSFRCWFCLIDGDIDLWPCGAHSWNSKRCKVFSWSGGSS